MQSLNRRKATIGAATGSRLPRSAGVTLIELLIVITLMAVISAVAIPRLNSRRFKLDQSAQLVRGSLQMAERLSVTK